MRKNYEAPAIESIQFEIEEAVAGSIVVPGGGNESGGLDV